MSSRHKKTVNIDFVVTWVDGSDAKWINSRNKYFKYEVGGIDSSQARYRDWGLMPYWFRAVEKNAPGVRKIFFVTCGQIPDWLNINNSRLEIIRHEDFIPCEYLPTFNSAAIEVNLHRIKGLSEHFVYFNDDMFLTDIISPEFFFRKGLPVDIGVENVVPLVSDSKFYVVNSIMRNGTQVINDHFSKRDFLKKNFVKWFSPLIGRNVIRNILLLPWKDFCGFYTFHMPTAFLKNTFHEVEEVEGELIKSVSEHRFRSDKDISQWLFQYWQLVKGQYRLPLNNRRKVFEIGKDDVKVICNAIVKKQYKVICINDVDCDGYDINTMSRELISAFNVAFPKKSVFENE